MTAGLRVLLLYSTPSSIALTLFSFFPLLQDELKLPVPAWYYLNFQFSRSQLIKFHRFQVSF